MAVLRSNVNFAKRIFTDRVGNEYDYGGNWNPFNLRIGTDCSGLVIDELDAAVNGSAMAWSRHGMSTESWRPIEVGEKGTIFGTICVASPKDFPADAAVKIAIHHGPGGGANSHMWCEIEGIRMESNGSDGCVTGRAARSVYDTSYANDWHYLPGPIVDKLGSDPVASLSTKDRYALATISEGRRLGITPKGICIALAVELVETNLTMYANSNVPASLGYPHEKVGSDHDSTGTFQQRQAWGPLSYTMDPTLSARLFFTGGQAGQRGLTDFDYNSNSRTPGGWAQAVQVSAFPDRYDERFAEAQQIYSRLSNLGDDDDMFTDDDRNLLNQIAGIFRPSLSPLRHLGEGNVNTCAGFAQTSDALAHPQFVAMAAKHGHRDSLVLLAEVAGADPEKYPDRVEDAKLATAILADLEATNPTVLQEFVAQANQKDAA
ncbi:MAG: chitinase [Mycobacterium sp.]